MVKNSDEAAIRKQKFIILDENNSMQTVGLFVTCLVDLMRPSIGFSTHYLLEQAGFKVVVPETQTCCGQPAYNSGDPASAQAVALKVLQEFEACDYLVAPSGSCAAMIKHDYPALFAQQPAVLARFQALQAKVYELTDFLVNVARFTPTETCLNACVTYHDSCSGLRTLGVYEQPRTLLAHVAGLQWQEMTESTTCCGFGGTFSVKFGDISTRMVDNKCDHITASGAQAIVGGDLGCLLNIEGRLRRRGDTQTQVYHVAQVLAGIDRFRDTD